MHSDRCINLALAHLVRPVEHSIAAHERVRQVRGAYDLGRRTDDLLDEPPVMLAALDVCAVETVAGTASAEQQPRLAVRGGECPYVSLPSDMRPSFIDDICQAISDVIVAPDAEGTIRAAHGVVTVWIHCLLADDACCRGVLTY